MCTNPGPPAPSICSVCDLPGADVVMAITATTSGPCIPVIAHEQCCLDRGKRPLRQLATKPQLRAEAFG